MEPTTSRTAVQAIQRLLINRDYARLWAASAISGFGDSVFETTLLVWIVTDLTAERPWAPFAVGGVFAASAVPSLLVGPIAGAFVDRWDDTRRVLLRTNLVSAALVAVLLPVAVLPDTTFGGGATADAIRLGLVLVVVVVASAVVQFLRPASGVLSRDIVPEPDRARAVGLSQASANVTMLVAPAVAAPVLIAFGPGVALAVNAASFLVAFVLVQGIRGVEMDDGPDLASSASPGALMRDIGVGIRFFRSSQVLSTITVTMCVAMLGFGALNALDLFFMEVNLRTDGRYYGFLESAQGAGMIAGAVAWAFLAGRIGLERSFWTSLAALGLLTMVYARLTDFPPALVLTVIIGTIVPALSVSLGPIMQRETPRHLLGRVSATINPLISGASLIGMVLGTTLYGAVLDDLDARVWGIEFGPIDTLYLAIGALTLVAAAYAALNLRAPKPVSADPVPAQSTGTTEPVAEAARETGGG